MALLSRLALFGGLLALAGTGLTDSAFAAASGQPEPHGIGLQDAANPIASQIGDFHHLLMVIVTAIVIFVTGLLAYVLVRFRKSANTVPSKTTHNTLIEVLWTVVPVLILVVIAVPSFKLLYAEDVVPETELTVKVTGRQWYWSYSYEHKDGEFEYDSYMLDDEEAAAQNKPRLLATDNAMVIPVNTAIRVQLTSSDVIHSFAVPSFGFKKDAIPGRLNELWIAPVREEGTYYGQCSELCGTGHSFMPIEVKVVSKEEYQQWLDSAYAEHAALDSTEDTVVLASAR